MFFRKSNDAGGAEAPKEKESIPTLITREMHILGNIISDGVVDLDGSLEGNIRCKILTVRRQGVIKGDVTADIVYVYGKIEGLVRARQVHLYASCHIEGVVMHESLTIEDGAFIDGKLKRTTKPLTDEAESDGDQEFPATMPKSLKLLENIRLIR